MCYFCRPAATLVSGIVAGQGVEQRAWLGTVTVAALYLATPPPSGQQITVTPSRSGETGLPSLSISNSSMPKQVGRFIPFRPRAIV